MRTPGPWKLAEVGPCTFDKARFIRSEKEGTEHGAVAVVALGADNADTIVAAVNAHDDLLWLVQRAQALRNVTRWSKAERERSWADWDARAMAAVKTVMEAA